MTVCTICGDPFWSRERLETCQDCRSLNLPQAEQSKARVSSQDAAVLVWNPQALQELPHRTLYLEEEP